MVEGGPPYIPQPRIPISLGMTTDETQTITTASRSGECLIQLYILDLDKVSLLLFDEPDTAVQRFVTAVTCNDPYFHDHADQKDLWKSFKSAYIEASDFSSRKNGAEVRKNSENPAKSIYGKVVLSSSLDTAYKSLQ